MKRKTCCLFVVGLLLGAAIHAEEPGCRSVDGLAPLFEPAAVVIFGELHGTAQAPAFVANAACLATAAGHAVTVALEIEDEEAERFNAYLDSSGSPEDRAALLEGAFWHAEFKDGRSSRAMVELLEALRQLRGAGRDVDVALFNHPPPERDRHMAEVLHGALAAVPQRLFLVLTGNIHSRVTRGTHWDEDYVTMGSVVAEKLGKRPLTSLDISHTGGTAWVCFGSTPADCGENSMRGQGEAGAEPIVLHGEIQGGHHGFYRVGAITASPPAVKLPADN